MHVFYTVYYATSIGGFASVTMQLPASYDVLNAAWALAYDRTNTSFRGVVPVEVRVTPGLNHSLTIVVIE
jgi:hypothetical protein